MVIDDPRNTLEAVAAEIREDGITDGVVDILVGSQFAGYTKTPSPWQIEVTDAPFQRLPRKGWVIGMAVKKENTELARALQQAVNELFDSGDMAALFNKHGVRSIKP
jgi:ABC-type amino acid transport substrate-binding protein